MTGLFQVDKSQETGASETEIAHYKRRAECAEMKIEKVCDHIANTLLQLSTPVEMLSQPKSNDWREGVQDAIDSFVETLGLKIIPAQDLKVMWVSE